MEAAGKSPLPSLDPDERQMLHEAYLSAKHLHRIPFDEAIEDGGLRICLKNLAEIQQKKRAARVGEAPPPLELTPPTREE